MREIKFRAWNAPLKKMEYNSLNAIGFDGRVYYGNADITGFFENIMQYTGLKDKNGRAIYEGDVYHQGDTNILYVVEYKGASFVGKQIRSSSYAGLEHWKDRIEVIGDVYRNPDLLEAAE